MICVKIVIYHQILYVSDYSSEFTTVIKICWHYLADSIYPNAVFTEWHYRATVEIDPHWNNG